MTHEDLVGHVQTGPRGVLPNIQNFDAEISPFVQTNFPISNFQTVGRLGKVLHLPFVRWIQAAFPKLQFLKICDLSAFGQLLKIFVPFQKKLWSLFIGAVKSHGIPNSLAPPSTPTGAMWMACGVVWAPKHRSRLRRLVGDSGVFILMPHPLLQNQKR